jgi:hypothetical protein
MGKIEKKRNLYSVYWTEHAEATEETTKKTGGWSLVFSSRNLNEKD